MGQGAGANLSFATGTLYMTGGGGLSVNIESSLRVPSIDANTLVVSTTYASTTVADNFLLATGTISQLFVNSVNASQISAVNILANNATFSKLVCD